MAITEEQMGSKSLWAIEIIKAASEAHRILEASPHLNMPNYDERQVRELNWAAAEAWDVLHRALFN